MIIKKLILIFSVLLITFIKIEGMENESNEMLVEKLKAALLKQDFESFKNIVESTHIDLNEIKWSPELTLFGAAIHKAIENRNLEFVKYLLKNGIEVNKPSYLSFTPLQIVVEKVALEPEISHDEQFLLEFINLLIDHGAIVDKKTLEFVRDQSSRGWFINEAPCDISRFYNRVLEAFFGEI